jgi:hypothetical protein
MFCISLHLSFLIFTLNTHIAPEDLTHLLLLPDARESAVAAVPGADDTCTLSVCALPV